MDWQILYDTETQKDYFINLKSFVDREYVEHTCFPPRDKVFNALYTTPFHLVKVVILGQDPYHGDGQAMGLSFSVPSGVKAPPSLVNIYKELQNEYGYPIPVSGDLTPWAKQGVLLLNAVLSVRAHQPASHANHGWETFTDAVLSALNDRQEPVVFMLWGRYAKNKKDLITNKQHLILEAAHPSPYSANNGFFGCGHFEKCNHFLQAHDMAPINWNLNT